MDLSLSPASSSTNNTTTTTTAATISTGARGPSPDDPPAILEAIPVITLGLDGGWFGKVATTAILLLGTFGNAMTVTILRRLRSGWSAMNVYLTALALSDTVMLYSGALPIWARKVLAYDVYASHAVVCKLGIWLMSASSLLSSWLLVALTAQRAASVVWPHRVNVICTRHKSVVTVAVIAAACSLLYSHMLYGFDVVRVEGNATSERCTFGSAAYQEFWVNVFVRMALFVYSVLPCACLLLSNAVLGWKLAVSVKDAKEKFSTAGSGVDQRGDTRRRKKASSATVTIIVVSAAFIVITVPFMVYNNLFFQYASEDSHARDVHFFLYDFFFVFSLSNFAWNFYLYCLTGSKFRGEFMKIVFRCCVSSVSELQSAAATKSAYVTEVGSGASRTVGTRDPNKGHVESDDDF